MKLHEIHQMPETKFQTITHDLQTNTHDLSSKHLIFPKNIVSTQQPTTKSQNSSNNPQTTIVSPHQLIPKNLLDKLGTFISNYKNGALTVDELQRKGLELIDVFQPRLSPYENYEIDEATKSEIKDFFKEPNPKIREDKLFSYNEEKKKILFFEIEKPLNERVKTYCRDGLNRFILSEKMKNNSIQVSKKDLMEMETNFQNEKVELKRVLIEYLQKRKYYLSGDNKRKQNDEVLSVKRVKRDEGEESTSTK